MSDIKSRAAESDRRSQPETSGAESATSAPASHEGTQHSRSTRRYAGIAQRYALLVALAILIVVFSVAKPDTFFTTQNATTILGIQSPAILLAIGVTVVLLVGEFDLSVASTMGLSASVIAFLTTQGGVPIVLACAIVLCFTLLIGLVNAYFVVKIGVHSFIVTLGMGTLVQGLAIGIAGSTTIGGLSPSFQSVFRTPLLGVQLAFLYVLVICAIFYLIIAKMPVGRSMFFTGNARAAAALAGVRTKRVLTGSFVTASLTAGVAGIVLVGQTGAASPTISSPYLLPAYAAGFLGATAFAPGRFNIWGTFWAVLFLAVGTTGFQLLGFDNWVIDFFNGAVLVLAVAFARTLEKRRKQRVRAV